MTETDWALIEVILKNRQFSIIRFRHNDALDDGYIGDFTPVLVMSDDRKQEVEEDYRITMQRFTNAIKKLKPRVG